MAKKIVKEQNQKLLLEKLNNINKNGTKFKRLYQEFTECIYYNFSLGEEEIYAECSPIAEDLADLINKG